MLSGDTFVIPTVNPYDIFSKCIELIGQIYPSVKRNAWIFRM